ncbi:MAG: exopolysaccharide biosynthesis protein [Anaerolineae bacterium]|jgi:hypothetical protein|nr:exopolysaccharide biosynthesis protein [Anaerolineae bacterium]
MSVQFQDTQRVLSETLIEITNSIKEEQVSVRRLLELIGEQGLLLFTMFLTIPFLVPVSIPGVSTVFGAVIILVSISITLNRLPWLPNRLMERTFETKDLQPVMERGAQMMTRLDQVLRPRMTHLTEGDFMNRLNGGVLTFGGILLIFPFGLIPFSNTLPAWGILLLAAGILQRDGLMILLGYLLMVITVIYFAFLIIGAIVGGAGLLSLLGS